jgi:capsular polysaccharide biosynthesis protein
MSAKDDVLVVAEETVKRCLPINLAAEDKALIAHEAIKHFREIRSTRLSGVQVSSTGYLARSWQPMEEGFAESPSGLRRGIAMGRGVWQALSSRQSAVVDRALFVTDESSNGFFHWICDVLPRLEALQAQAEGEMASRRLVIPAMAMFAYVQESLLPFPIQGTALVKAGERVLCRDLLVIPGLAPTGNYRPGFMAALRERMRSFFSIHADNRRIFISRAQAPRRRIANEAALGPVLRRHGFEQAVLEDLSFAAQIRLVGSGAVLVGSHGAGLTNMCWMTTGSRVLELRRRGDARNNCYFSLASALGLPYWYMLCEPVEPSQDSHVGDLFVNPDGLDRILTDMLKAVDVESEA